MARGNFVVTFEGSEVAKQLRYASEEVRLAAVKAINKVTRDAHVKGGRLIASQINFPKGYVQSNERFVIGPPATRAKMESRISARERPTSLARFVSSERPVTAQVRTRVTRLPRAFLIPLRRGNVEGDNSNRGLAIRLKPGETINNKTIKAKRMKGGLALLYAPSVQQVFIANDGSGVAEDMSPSLAARLGAEFLRLVRLL